VSFGRCSANVNGSRPAVARANVAHSAARLLQQHDRPDLVDE